MHKLLVTVGNALMACDEIRDGAFIGKHWSKVEIGFVPFDKGTVFQLWIVLPEVREAFDFDLRDTTIQVGAHIVRFG